MIVSIIDEIKQFFERIPTFLDKNDGNPLFWVAILLVMVAITFYAVNKLGDK